MKNKSLLSISVSIVIIGLLGCGGGGGGGSGGGKSARPSTGLRVLNANIDLAPVEIFLGDEASPRTKAIFSNSSDWISTNGAQSVNLKRANTDDAVKTVSVTLKDNEVQSILLYGDLKSFGLRVSNLDDTLPVITSGNAAVRIIHGTVGAAQVAASVGATSIATSTTFGTASEYVLVPAGTSALKAKRVSDSSILYDRPFTFEDGKAYSLLLSGDTNYLAVGEVLED